MKYRNTLRKITMLLISGCMAFAQTACDKADETSEYRPETGDPCRAIVINEGQFGYGTASLTVFNKSGSVLQDVFRNVNNRPMGDIAQSMTLIGDNYFVPLNNSRKIEVFDSETFKSVETISINEDVIPMYVQHLGGDSIAVTDQMWRNSSSKLMIIDINPNRTGPALRRYVPIAGQTFQMKLIQNKLFVGGTKLAVFDLDAIDEENLRYILTDAGESIQATDFSKIVSDKNGMVWVLSQYWLYCIDPVSERVIHTVSVGDLRVNPRISSLDISTDGSTVYFNVHTSVYAVDVNNITPPVEPVISPEVNKSRTIYHMCVSKENTIFMCDVLYGSLSRAIIHEYDPDTGQSLNEFKAGIFPHSIFFK